MQHTYNVLDQDFTQQSTENGFWTEGVNWPISSIKQGMQFTLLSNHMKQYQFQNNANKINQNWLLMHVEIKVKQC